MPNAWRFLYRVSVFDLKKLLGKAQVLSALIINVLLHDIDCLNMFPMCVDFVRMLLYSNC